MGTKKIAILAAVLLILTLLPVNLFADDYTARSSRIYGADRVETALEVCEEGWGSSYTVIVAPADQANLIDALAAAPLAGQENAPILLTYKDSLDSRVRDMIKSLGADKVYVIGAISSNVSKEIDAISGVEVVVLKGENRWETTKLINNQLHSIQGTFVVGYKALADALSVSPYAAANRYAIILADVQGRIPAGQNTLGSEVFLIGGPTLVADISGATRLAGQDRFDTNRLILEDLYFSFDKVYLANGYDNHLVDSLIASPLAAKDRAPVVLTDNNTIKALSQVRGRMNSSSEVVALGGPTVVSDRIKDTLAGGSSYTGAFKVQDIIPISLNSFKVVFSDRVDKDTAELVSNYIIDGDALDPGYDNAVLQSDERTVIVMVDQDSASEMAPFSQQEKVLIEVNEDMVLNKDRNDSAPSFTKDVVFHDITVPRVQTVTAYGNKKLVVEFSEPINVLSLTSGVKDWKIDNTYLSAFGLNSSACKAINPTWGTAFPIAYAVELYFDGTISSGTHTLTVKEGISGINGFLVDGANFPIMETSKDFRVESYTTRPQVQSVTVRNNKVEVKFNRAMYEDPLDPNSGTGSALNISYYDINSFGESGDLSSSPLASLPQFKSGSGDTIVEFKVDSGVISRGLNILEIDKDMEDAWGNRLSSENNLRFSFDYREDTTKPAVQSVICLSDTKVRIHFSKMIDKLYAQNRSNYTIKDRDGVEIFGRSAGGSAVTVPPDQDSDTVELIMPSGTYLHGSGYTLRIENLRDTSIDFNLLNTYVTTFNGQDDWGPELLEVIADSNDSTKAICFFSEELSPDSVRVANFGYKDGAGLHQNLPSGSNVSLDSTGKIVTVDFPSSYTVKTSPGGSDNKYEVNAIRASNIKDKAGNIMRGIAMTVNVQANASDTSRPHYVQNTFNLLDDGDYVRAEFRLSQQMSLLEEEDFSIGAEGVGFAGGTVPDGVYSSGDKIVMRFSSADKARAVRALGPNAYLYSKAQGNIQSKSYAGVAMLEFSTAGYQVYDDRIKPQILSYSGFNPISLTYDGDNAIIKVAFSEPIDPSIVGYYEDDFAFSCSGGSLDVKSVTVDSTNKNVLNFNVGPAADISGSTITVTPYTNDIDIRDLRDRGPEDHNVYVPSNDDKKGYSVSDTTPPTVVSVVVDSSTEKVKVTFSEAIFAPNSYSDFTIDSPYDEGKTTAAVTGTAWTWASDKKSVELTFGGTDFKANDTYYLVFTSPGSGKYKDLGNHYLASVNKSGFVNTAAADTTAPTVTVMIGDGKGDGESIADGSSVYIRFSEKLNDASKTAVETALNNAKAGATLNYAWDDATAKLTATASGGTVTFSATVTCNISDGTNPTTGATLLDP